MSIVWKYLCDKGRKRKGIEVCSECDGRDIQRVRKTISHKGYRACRKCDL